MAKIITIIDFRVRAFHLAKVDGLWEAILDGDEIDAAGNPVHSITHQFQVPLPQQSKLDGLADALLRFAKQERGIEDAAADIKGMIK